MEEKDADTSRVPEGRISPKMTPVHMCALYNKTEIIECVMSPTNINMQDQVHIAHVSSACMAGVFHPGRCMTAKQSAVAI